MADYETEEQQVEALKRWWAENGKAVVFGIVLGLGGIFGWRAWQGHQLSVAENASSAYTTVMESLQNEDGGDTFLKNVAAMKDEHSGSSYAAMASLAEARYHVEKDDLESAESALRWTLDKGAFNEVKSVARLRLARVLNARQKYEEALGMLDSVESQAYAGLVDEIRGDIYLAKGDPLEARNAYLRAQASGATTASAQHLQMKLDDLAQPESSASADEKS